MRSRRRSRSARTNAQPEGDVLEDRHMPEERVVLKDEADAALRAVRSLMSSPSNWTDPASANSSPAMMRSSVVLPEPDGPSSATSCPRGISRSTASSAVNCPNRLVIPRNGDAHAGNLRNFCGFPFDDALDHQRRERQERQQRSDGERRDELIIVVEHFDLQRHRIGQTADVTRNHRYRSELSHRARVAKNHAIEQRPLDVGKRDAQERLPSVGAKRQGGFFLVVALRGHHRQQLARNERQRHENRRQDDARNREDDVNVVRGQPRSQRILARRRAARTSSPRRPARPKTAGRSARSSRLLPKNSNLPIAQAAAMPKTTFAGTAIAAASSVSRIAEMRIGVGEAAKVCGDALTRRRPRRSTASGTKRNTVKKTTAGADQQSAHGRRLA